MAQVTKLTEEQRQDKDQEIRDLMSSLTSGASEIGDWKVAKYQEYQLAGKEAPYDIAELHAKRQAVRDRINALRAELGSATK